MNEASPVHLEKFFLVTVGGTLYLVSSERNETGCPTVMTLADGRFGAVAGDKFSVGIFVAIFPDGIGLYGDRFDPSSYNCPNKIRHINILERTDAVSALFFEEDKARNYLRDSKVFRKLDRRLIPITRSVIDYVGQNHPIFKIPGGVWLWGNIPLPNPAAA